MAIAHPEKAALARSQRTSRKPAPAKHSGDFFHGRRREICAIAARLERARRDRKQRQTLARAVHLRRKLFVGPSEAAECGLNRLVRAVVQAPLQIEARHLMPVALAER